MLQNHIDIDVVVCKQADMADHLRRARTNGYPFDILVSIKSPRPDEQQHVPYEPPTAAFLTDAVEHIIVECPEHGTLTKAEREAFTQGVKQTAASIRTRAGHGRAPHILVHCYSGNTRSLSFALALLELVSADKKLKKINEVISSRRCAAPRDDLIRLATRALRGGLARPEEKAAGLIVAPHTPS